MSRVKQNVVANIVGKSWIAIMGLAFIPYYTRRMGMEVYGLIGLYATLQALFELLDMGLSATMNREMARHTAQEDRAQDARDLVRTLEVFYWPLGLAIALIVIAAAPLLAHRWVHAEQLDPATIQRAICLMGGVLALQWPLSFYAGGLMGLQRQVAMNGINAAAATLRNGGAAVVLLFAPNVLAFFAWQMFACLLQTFALALMLWRALPAGTRRARFHPPLLRSVWKFAAGMTSISLVSLALTQADKVVLSRMLPLREFGYYTLATTIASGLVVLIVSVHGAVFPRFSSLAATSDEAALRPFYHRACQLMTVLIAPAALVMALFAQELMLLWTGDPVKVEATKTLVRLLTLGTLLNGMMHIPYALQLAYGWTSLTFYANLIAVCVLAPLLIVMVARYGGIGAAWVWILLNCGYILIVLQCMHRRLLIGELSRWYLDDFARPLLAALCAGLLLRFALPPLEVRWVCAPVLAGTWFVLQTAALLAAPLFRQWILDRLAMRRRPNAEAVL